MKLIDLTMSLNNFTPTFPSDPKPEFKQISFLEKNGWNEHIISFGTHFGTHIDVPFHMIKNGKKLSDYSINKFVGNGTVIDVRGLKNINVNLQGIQKKDIILFRTDHTKQINSDTYFTSFPIITDKLANQIVNKKIKIIGIDSFTFDVEPFEIHKYFLNRDVLCLENLVNLDLIPSKNFKLFIFPMKLDDMDGAPCRVVAQIK